MMVAIRLLLDEGQGGSFGECWGLIVTIGVAACSGLDFKRLRSRYHVALHGPA
jgi:hypothetical protein